MRNGQTINNNCINCDVKTQLYVEETRYVHVTYPNHSTPRGQTALSRPDCQSPSRGSLCPPAEYTHPNKYKSYRYIFGRHSNKGQTATPGSGLPSARLAKQPLEKSESPCLVDRAHAHPSWLGISTPDQRRMYPQDKISRIIPVIILYIKMQ